jgi:H+/Cl- antiporter ClcA
MSRFPVQTLAAVKWLAVLVPMAVVIGSESAFVMWSLDALTRVRFANPGLFWLLPVGGFVVGWIYQYYGRTADGGNNLLIDEIHQPGAGVPRRMAPLILFGTLITHLFGGSAGREGTALQVGGGIAATFVRFLKMDESGVRLLMMAGVAAGFGSVFGRRSPGRCSRWRCW